MSLKPSDHGLEANIALTRAMLLRANADGDKRATSRLAVELADKIKRRSPEAIKAMERARGLAR